MAGRDGIERSLVAVVVVCVKRRKEGGLSMETPTRRRHNTTDRIDIAQELYIYTIDPSVTDCFFLFLFHLFLSLEFRCPSLFILLFYMAPIRQVVLDLPTCFFLKSTTWAVINFEKRDTMSFVLSTCRRRRKENVSLFSLHVKKLNAGAAGNVKLAPCNEHLCLWTLASVSHWLSLRPFVIIMKKKD